MAKQRLATLGSEKELRFGAMDKQGETKQRYGAEWRRGEKQSSGKAWDRDEMNGSGIAQ